MADTEANLITELYEKIAALESQLAEATTDAKRNIGVLQTQLTNCHETMRKDGVSHAKALLALEAVEWVGAFIRCPWCGAVQETGHRADCQRQLTLLSLAFTDTFTTNLPLLETKPHDTPPNSQDRN